MICIFRFTMSDQAGEFTSFMKQLNFPRLRFAVTDWPDIGHVFITEPIIVLCKNGWDR